MLDTQPATLSPEAARPAEGLRLTRSQGAGMSQATDTGPRPTALPPVQGAIARLLLTAEGATADALLIYADAAEEAAQHEAAPASANGWRRLAVILRDVAPHYPAARLDR